MRHVRETMPGSGDSGTGAKPTPSHIRPTTNHTLHTQQAPQPRPRLFCPHSPNCTQPTGTSRCPAPTRHPGLASAPLMRSKRRPPRPKHPTFTQFHRSGLHFGRIHPQHRPICPHSPICTQPTDTPRCPAPTRHPGLASAPFMRSKRRPPRPNTPHSPNFTEVVCTLGASIPNTVRSAQIHQSARNPRVHHAAQPPPGTPASHPHHSCAQNADHLAQNTPHSLNFTEVVCALGAHRTIGSTSKETQWMRIRSTPLRRTHTPPQVRTTLSAVDSLGVLSWASW